MEKYRLSSIFFSIFFIFRWLMSDMNLDKNNLKFEIIEIIENVAVIYHRGKEKKEVFDAIYITKDGVFTGFILKKYDNNFYEEFIECGYIPNHNIKTIEGSARRKVYKRLIS